MQPSYPFYIFDSRLANEAAQAVEDGHCHSILEYHHNKHTYTQQLPQLPPSLHYHQPPQPQLSPHIQHSQQANLSPQSIHDRNSKISRVNQVALLTTSQRQQQSPPQPPPLKQQPLKQQQPQQHQQQQQQHQLHLQSPINQKQQIQQTTVQPQRPLSQQPQRAQAQQPQRPPSQPQLQSQSLHLQQAHSPKQIKLQQQQQQQQHSQQSINSCDEKQLSPVNQHMIKLSPTQSISKSPSISSTPSIQLASTSSSPNQSQTQTSPQDQHLIQTTILSPVQKALATIQESEQNVLHPKESNNIKKPINDILVPATPDKTSPKSSKQQASPELAIKINNSKNKVNRRRSSERRESLREGLMRTLDFVIALKDLSYDHPSLWRITGNNLLQQFKPIVIDNIVLYENTNKYAGWNSDIRKEYVGVDVKLTQHTRNQITVERLSLNVQKIEDSEVFYNKHFAVFLQILINTVLDPKFWEGLEGEKDHYDYFMVSRKIIDDITSRYKKKLSSKWKLDKSIIKRIETYPQIKIEDATKVYKDRLCRACNTNPTTELLSFEDKTYDLHTLETLKLSEESLMTDKDEFKTPICNDCLNIVETYSEIHHLRWRLFNIVKQKIVILRAKGLSFKEILDECFTDEDWISSIYMKRDNLWSKVEEHVHI